MKVDPGWVCNEFLRKLAAAEKGEDFKLGKPVNRGEKVIGEEGS
jgi:hypothetical protein